MKTDNQTPQIIAAVIIQSDNGFTRKGKLFSMQDAPGAAEKFASLVHAQVLVMDESAVKSFSPTGEVKDFKPWNHSINVVMGENPFLVDHPKTHWVGHGPKGLGECRKKFPDNTIVIVGEHAMELLPFCNTLLVAKTSHNETADKILVIPKTFGLERCAQETSAVHFFEYSNKAIRMPI